MKQEFSLINAIFARIMKEKKLYVGYRKLLAPNYIDQMIKQYVKIKRNGNRSCFIYKRLSNIFLPAIWNQKRSLFSMEKLRQNKEVVTFFNLMNTSRIEIDGIVVDCLKQWIITYLKRLLENNLNNFENYIQKKHKNKVNTLEQYIDYCITHNKNIFQIINAVTLFIKTEESYQFWTNKHNLFVSSVKDLLLSKSMLQNITYQGKI